MIKFPKEYLDDILVRMAHHSSAIEGNDITLPETVSIILHKSTPNRMVPYREFFEVQNHEQAFDYMMDEIQNKKPMTLSTVTEIHALLTDRLLVDRGQFKKSENAIMGAEFQTASPAETPLLMKQWVDNLNFRLGLSNEYKDTLETVADMHIQFERIHPFSDGNGRTGRMLMNYSLLEKNMPPLIIDSKEKGRYVELLANQDVKGLADFMKETLQEELKRVKQFQNSASKQLDLDDLEQ